MGLNSARKLKKDKKQKKKSVTKELNGAPQAKGVVIATGGLYSRSSYRNYGTSSACDVKLSTGKIITAHIPLDGCASWISANDIVMLEGRGRPGRNVGDVPAKLRVVKVQHDGGGRFIEPHEKIVMEGRGRPGRSVGDNPTKLRVVKVSNVSLDAICQGKREKPRH